MPLVHAYKRMSSFGRNRSLGQGLLSTVVSGGGCNTLSKMNRWSVGYGIQNPNLQNYILLIAYRWHGNLFFYRCSKGYLGSCDNESNERHTRIRAIKYVRTFNMLVGMENVEQ